MTFAHKTTAAFAAALFAAGSQASVFSPGLIADFDPDNDTAAGAAALGELVLFPTALLTAGGTGFLSEGDVDWFLLELDELSIVTVTTTPLVAFSSEPDTTLGFWDTAGGLPVGAPLTDDDEGPLSLGSALQAEAGPGEYFISVSGFSDFDFDGFNDGTTDLHFEEGPYAIQVTVYPVPEPASFALAGLGALAIASRRRK